MEIVAVGRLGAAGWADACRDYYRRCAPLLRVEEREVRDAAALARAIPRGALVVALDQRGEQLTSEAFARRLSGWLAGAGGRLVFVLGGADGLDDATRARARHLLSLGPMTLAHKVARLVLAEQLYRAVSILRGDPYHRA